MNNGKICVSVCAETAVKMIENIRAAEEFADVIEVRFDCLNKSEIRKTIKNLPEIKATYLFTFRPKHQGGHREIPLPERLKLWEVIFYHHKSNFMIDIEGDPEMMFAIETKQVQRILSLHNFDGVWKNPDGLFRLLSNQGDIAKLAATVEDAVNAISIWKLIELASSSQKRVIPIAMGEAGKWTRILGLAHGAFLTYASLDTGGETAPGQVTARDLRDLYRVKELDLETKVYGVIGDPVSQSLSTYMHNPAFVAGCVNAVFIPFLVKDIGGFMRWMVRAETREVELNFGGFSVTMPHKQSIMKHLDKIDATAEKIGAVNTVKIEGGKLTGFNTDADGFITPLKKHFGNLKGARVAVCGAGGAARACIFALKREGADVEIFVRDEAKAKSFSDEFEVNINKISNLKYEISDPKTKGQKSKTCLHDFDILVDTTPLGMNGLFENDSLFTASQLDGVKFVYDLVTKPYDTPIICEAKKADIPSIGGLEMLVAQGAKQFEIWTGQSAPVQQMTESVVARISEIQK